MAHSSSTPGPFHSPPRVSLKESVNSQCHHCRDTLLPTVAKTDVLTRDFDPRTTIELLRQVQIIQFCICCVCSACLALHKKVSSMHRNYIKVFLSCWCFQVKYFWQAKMWIYMNNIIISNKFKLELKILWSKVFVAGKGQVWIEGWGCVGWLATAQVWPLWLFCLGWWCTLTTWV